MRQELRKRNKLTWQPYASIFFFSKPSRVNMIPLFFVEFIFNWRIIALQCCVGFCHVSTRISHRYAYIRSRLNLPPTSLPIPPPHAVREQDLSSLLSYSKFSLSYLSWGCLPWWCAPDRKEQEAWTVGSPVAPPSPLWWAVMRSGGLVERTLDVRSKDKILDLAFLFKSSVAWNKPIGLSGL